MGKKGSVSPKNYPVSRSPRAGSSPRRRRSPSPRRRFSKSPSPKGKKSERSPSPRRKRSRSPSPRRRDSRSPPRYKFARFGTDEERKESSTLFVGNLPNYYREGEVRDAFERYGPLASVTLGMNKVGVAYAFVEYQHKTDAEEALKKTDGTIMGDKFKLRVDWDIGKDKKRTKRRPRPPPPRPRFYGRDRDRDYGRRYREYSPRRSRSRSRSYSPRYRRH